ncbi:MAG: hypothetical protein IT364_26195 [Candidatus Hydrogenedentes bacterium]|nr:hypothetical protein [Candidatus Hydrogenedentota bacterium]
MLKAQIDRILEVERDARERIAEAERQAKAMVDEARAQRGALIEQARAAALADAEEALQNAIEEAARDKARILVDARAVAEGYTAGVSQIAVSFLKDAAQSIAGLRT